MPPSKPHITRTFGTIHFEDLDPHRFEDLIRELVYDFKDWQSLEATGRSGSDDGIDIRAFERVNFESRPEELNGDDFTSILHPMEGDQWNIQVKREKEIGPKAIVKILEEVDNTNPPYGYILAAATNFSKKSYDTFREELVGKGVMEFYLWGKAELEDMLHQPKNDRILFTFFGVSLISRRKSRATAVRSVVTTKNKLYRTFEHEAQDGEFYEKVLIRDLKDDKYPYDENYPDFEENPRWKEYTAFRFHPNGLVVHAYEYFAYVDTVMKQYDFCKDFNFATASEEFDPDRWQKYQQGREGVEEFWNFMPKPTQGYLVIDALIKYEDIAIVDDKGDGKYHCPHIYVDFSGQRGPFGGYLTSLRVRDTKILLEDDWTLSAIFPEKFEKAKKGKRHLGRTIKFDDLSHLAFKNNSGSAVALYDLDGRYDFLSETDVIDVVDPTTSERVNHVQITNVYKMTIAEYLKYYGNDYNFRRAISAQLQIEDLAGQEDREIIIYEYRRIYSPDLYSKVPKKKTNESS